MLCICVLSVCLVGVVCALVSAVVSVVNVITCIAKSVVTHATDESSALGRLALHHMMITSTYEIMHHHHTTASTRDITNTHEASYHIT